MKSNTGVNGRFDGIISRTQQLDLHVQTPTARLFKYLSDIHVVLINILIDCCGFKSGHRRKDCIHASRRTAFDRYLHP